MNPKEVLATQLFPIRLEHSHGKPVCSFQLQRPRARAAVAGQAGNAMNCAVIGTVILYVLLQVPLASDGLKRLRKLRCLTMRVHSDDEGSDTE